MFFFYWSVLRFPGLFQLFSPISTVLADISFSSDLLFDLFAMLFWAVSRAPTTISIIVPFIFHCHFYLSRLFQLFGNAQEFVQFFAFLHFAGTAKSTRWQILFFLLINTKSGWDWMISFSTDSALCIYHLSFQSLAQSLVTEFINPGTWGGCLRGVMVKAMDCGIVVCEFVLQSRYYVHFRANTLGKGMNPLILPAMG